MMLCLGGGGAPARARAPFTTGRRSGRAQVLSPGPPPPPRSSPANPNANGPPPKPYSTVAAEQRRRRWEQQHL